jgi:hypothetical protein
MDMGMNKKLLLELFARAQMGELSRLIFCEKITNA